jgi:hypothetical protein
VLWIGSDPDPAPHPDPIVLAKYYILTFVSLNVIILREKKLRFDKTVAHAAVQKINFHAKIWKKIIIQIRKFLFLPINSVILHKAIAKICFARMFP